MATASVTSALVKQDIFTFRIIKLILEYGGIVYRRCLERRANCTQEGTLEQYLIKKKSHIQELQKQNVITQEQFDKIFPQGQAVSTAIVFDITLLAFLIRNTCPCEHQQDADEKKKWSRNNIEDLLVNDLSETADLIRIKIFRNQIAHVETTKQYDEFTFNIKWTEIAEVLIRRCPNLKSGIDELKLCAIDTDLQIELGQLKCQMNEWECMDEKLKELEFRVAGLDQQLHKIEQRVICLETKDTTVTTGNEGVPLLDVPSMHGEETLSAEKWKIVKMLQYDCICYYRKVLRKLQLSPLIEEEEYAANFFDVYVKPNIKILSHQELKGQSKSTPVTFHDIFSSKPCPNIYISSPAGCGKTSFAKYLALIWCQAHQPIVSDSQRLLEEDVNEMRTFMFLFIVFLQDSHESECDVDIMIQNQLLPNLSNSITYTELGLKFLQNLLSSVKCIIILDGLDEWSHPAGNTCMLKNKHIPHSRARPLCTTLTTSRPWKLDVVGLKPGEIDQKLEINGLDDDLFKRLINNVVTKMNKAHGKQMQVYDFERVLKTKKLSDLSKIPVVVMQLLTVWFDNEPLGESQCEIYSNMIEFLLKRYCKKREIVSEMEDIEVDDCSRDRQIPMCLQNNMYCKVHVELLSKLATLAYNTLFTDNKETSLVFDRRTAKKYLTDKEIEMSLEVGILTQEKVIGKMSKRQSHISFIHKTFQEYLVALYVALSPGMVANVEDKIKHVCCSIEKILEMSQIFMFLSGLCPEVMVNLNEHLRQTVSEDSRTQRYRASGELAWLSVEGEILVRVQDTMMEWLGECWLNGHKHVTHLPASDFFIWSHSPWSAELKSLALHNPVCTLCVYDDDYSIAYSPEKIEDILNSVTVFNCIQKLLLSDVLETFVGQLVCQHKHSLSVKPETWRHLRWLTVQRVEDMSGEILCSLADCILQLPKSVQVRLRYCRVIQGTRDWKAYIQSHPRFIVDNDIVDDDWWTNVTLLQFHTSKV